LWTKPAASLANPDEEIPVNDFCAKSLLDYEVCWHAPVREHGGTSLRKSDLYPPLTYQGELVFVTSREAKNVSVADAKSYILGYTIGNDLSCRMYQLPKYSAGQFFFAKAFDKFAPIGPALISPEAFGDGSKYTIVTKVNGDVRQTADFTKDMIFDPSKILSHMSQGTSVLLLDVQIEVRFS
jgi:2-keto-4-pentenoate hydratase/2-oxohepta-3-ene-1,7-dioic acid hydratase in catechol pathway